MSRTHHDAPPWVRRARSAAVEDHDHRHGTCDLPTRAEWVELDRDGLTWSVSRNCRWRPADVHDPLLCCNCDLCGTWGRGRKNLRRTHRRKTAQQCRDIASGLVDPDAAVWDSKWRIC